METPNPISTDNSELKNILQENFDGRLPWLKGRQKYIGSSDAPALFGFGYSGQSATSVWLSKVHDVEPEFSAADLERLEEGRIGEQFVIAMFSNRHQQYQVVNGKPFSFIVCKEHPYLCASLDAYATEVDGKIIPIEAKVITHLWEEWEDGKTPDRYTIQVMHQLLCTGAERGVLVGYVRGEYQQRWIYRDEAVIQQMLIGYQRFWQNVIDRTPPVDADPKAYESLRRIPVVTGTAKIAGGKLDKTARELLEVDKEATRLSDRRDQLRAEIAREVMGAEYLVLQDQTCLKLGKRSIQHKPSLPRGIRTV